MGHHVTVKLGDGEGRKIVRLSKPGIGWGYEEMEGRRSKAVMTPTSHRTHQVLLMGRSVGLRPVQANAEDKGRRKREWEGSGTPDISLC